MTITMIAHIGKLLELGGVGALLAAELAAVLAALSRSWRRKWRRAGASGRARNGRCRGLSRGSAEAAKARQQSARPEGFRHISGKRGGDRAFLAVEHRKDRGGVGPVRRVLLADRAHHHVRDGADQGLGGALWSARILAQRGREACEAPAAEEAAQEIGALGQGLGVAAGDSASELGQKLGVGVGDRVRDLLGAARRRRRRAERGEDRRNRCGHELLGSRVVDAGHPRQTADHLRREVL